MLTQKQKMEFMESGHLPVNLKIQLQGSVERRSEESSGKQTRNYTTTIFKKNTRIHTQI